MDTNGLSKRDRYARKLSPRMREAALLLREGVTTPQLAKRMGISYANASRYITNLREFYHLPAFVHINWAEALKGVEL